MDKETLIQAMMKGGHSRISAENTINSRGMENMWSEYMGGSTTSGSENQNDYVTSLINTLTQQAVPQALEFDEVGARAASEQQWNPYYDQLLEDYLNEVTIGRGREGEDLATYLSELDTRRGRTLEDLATSMETLDARKEDYLGDINRESPLIQEAIGGSAADRGAYFSGGRVEDQNLQLEKEARDKERYGREYGTEKTRLETNAGRTEEEYTRQQEARELQNRRYLADVERRRKERERTLAQEREAAITGGVVTRKEEQYLGYS